MFFGLVFFRANTVADAFIAYKQMFTSFGRLFVDANTIGYGILAIMLLMFKDYINEYHPNVKFLNSDKPLVSIIATALLLCLILLVGVFDGGQFIYFQF